jgi:SAM-dependent methyltransferase
MGTGARVLTSLRLRAQDAAERLGGPRDQLLPPRRLRGRVGDGDFVAIGDAMADRLAADAALTADSVVLDVGCGCGRVARPLVAALGARGRYTGFDVDAQAIAWCGRAYAADDRFRFVHADVANAHYRPDGGAAATGYRFPADDGSVDVVVAASVLTHRVRARRPAAGGRRVRVRPSRRCRGGRRFRRPRAGRGVRRGVAGRATRRVGARGQRPDHRELA